MNCWRGSTHREVCAVPTELETEKTAKSELPEVSASGIEADICDKRADYATDRGVPCASELVAASASN